MKRFPQKRIVITGAGSGLGRALALEFARMGWRIGVADINNDRARETVQMINGSGGSGMALHCDVTKLGDVEKMARRIRDQWGGVDILVNNAGVAAAGYMERIPMETWNWILSLNLMSIIHGCRTFVPMMEESGCGHIVNVASAAGIAALPEMSCYNVSKGAAITLSESLRLELSVKNIGVTLVCPSFFKTNLMEQFTSPDERQRRLAQGFFDKSKMTAEDVARAAVAAVRRNRFYVVPGLDSRLIWWFKRRMPAAYFAIAAMVYRKGLIEKYLES